MQYDVLQATFATALGSLTSKDGQDRTTYAARCNVEGNATFPSSRRPKFGIVGIIGVSFVPCLRGYESGAWSLLSWGETIQVGTAIDTVAGTLSVSLLQLELSKFYVLFRYGPHLAPRLQAMINVGSSYVRVVHYS